MTINIEKLVGITAASFKVQINGRIVLVPARMISGYQNNKLTFHNKKYAMSIFSMI